MRTRPRPRNCQPDDGLVQAGGPNNPGLLQGCSGDGRYGNRGFLRVLLAPCGRDDNFFQMRGQSCAKPEN